MNVTYIIPIKNYLAKYISPKNGKIYHEGIAAIEFALNYYYAGYKMNKKQISKLYIEKKLFKRAKPNQYPKEFLSRYPIEKYTYLKFNFPVTHKRLGKLLNNKEINEDYAHYIMHINISLDIKFWNDSLRAILYNRNSTINQAIDDFYSFYGIVDSDYKKNSFKTMLYRLKKSNLIF